MRPQVGQVINNKYRLIRLVGDGGMGSVYEARHEVLGTSVALKFLHPELARRPGLVQRFLQEARVSAQIQSPHVVRVTDVDQSADGFAYIVMEYLEGRTLQTLYEDLYRQGSRLSLADGLEYALQMIEGVEAAHKTGIVHRDLKPDNVIITVTPKGAPLLKLLDFGIAKLKVTGQLDRGLTRPGVIMGTPEYMAPEQAYSADAVDARADIFSLGVIIFEMLAGRRPVGGDDPQQIAGAYLSGQVSRLADLVPGISPDLAAVVHRAMAPLPNNRFATITELREAIEPFAHALRPPSGGRFTATPGPAAVAGAMSPASSLHASHSPVSYAPATNIGDEPPRSIPKTLPPDGNAATTPGPAAFGSPRGPTPLGGFDIRRGDGDANIRNAPSARAMGLAATETNPPFQPSRGDRTSFASPLAHAHGPEATVSSHTPAAPYGVGGTVAGGGYRPTAGGGATVGAGFAGTAPMGSPYGAANARPLSVEPRKAAKRGVPFIAILGLASAVAGLVVGGLYFASYHAKAGDHVDDPPVMNVPTATTVTSDPPQLPPVVTVPAATTKPPPVATVKPPSTHPTTPGPTPTAPPTATQPPPPMLPSVLPPFPFPFPNPFGVPNPQQPPQQQPPQQQPPAPTTTTTTGKPRAPIFFPIPVPGPAHDQRLNDRTSPHEHLRRGASDPARLHLFRDGRANR